MRDWTLAISQCIFFLFSLTKENSIHEMEHFFGETPFGYSLCVHDELPFSIEVVVRFSLSCSQICLLPNNLPLHSYTL